MAIPFSLSGLLSILGAGGVVTSAETILFNYTPIWITPTTPITIPGIPGVPIKSIPIPLLGYVFQQQVRYVRS